MSNAPQESIEGSGEGAQSNDVPATEKQMFRKMENGLPKVEKGDKITTGWYVPGIVDPAQYEGWVDDVSYDADKFNEMKDFLELCLAQGSPTRDAEADTSVEEVNVAPTRSSRKGQHPEVASAGYIDIHVQSMLKAAMRRSRQRRISGNFTD